MQFAVDLAQFLGSGPPGQVALPEMVSGDDTFEVFACEVEAHLATRGGEPQARTRVAEAGPGELILLPLQEVVHMPPVADPVPPTRETGTQVWGDDDEGPAFVQSEERVNPASALGGPWPVVATHSSAEGSPPATLRPEPVTSPVLPLASPQVGKGRFGGDQTAETSSGETTFAGGERPDTMTKGPCRASDGAWSTVRPVEGDAVGEPAVPVRSPMPKPDRVLSDSVGRTESMAPPPDQVVAPGVRIPPEVDQPGPIDADSPETPRETEVEKTDRDRTGQILDCPPARRAERPRLDEAPRTSVQWVRTLIESEADHTPRPTARPLSADVGDTPAVEPLWQDAPSVQTGKDAPLPETRSAPYRDDLPDAVMESIGPVPADRPVDGPSNATPPTFGPHRSWVDAGLRLIAPLPNVAHVEVQPDDTLCVTLEPEDLGRLRVSFQQGEHGAILHVIAERVETIELVKRHVDMLGAELRREGFSGFSFGAETGSGSSGHGDSGSTPASTVSDPIPAGPSEPRRTPDGRLDLRV